QAEDQLYGIVGKRRATGAGVWVGPPSPDESALPVEDRPWCDQKRAPSLARHETGEEGDEGPIGPGEAGTGDLTTQNCQLVAQHENLRVLGHLVHPIHEDQLEDAPEEPVEEGQRRELRASPSASWLVKSGRRVNALFRYRNSPPPYERAERCSSMSHVI